MDVDSWVPTVGDGAANFTPANILLDFQNVSSPTPPWDGGPDDLARFWEGQDRLNQGQPYRDFTTSIQVLILIGSLISNATVLWCTCCTTIFRTVTGRFIRNLACSGIGAGLACVPFDLALGGSPACCWWLRTLLVCKALKFLHKLFCSVTVLSFAAIGLDRYYSVLYPLERKISDARSRDLLIYIWLHAAVASAPVFAVTNVTDIYAASSCSDSRARSPGHRAYVAVYNVTTVILPLAVVFVLMALIRRALSASQKKKAIIAALRTPQSSVSIPYVSQREAELHATLLAVVLAFSACSAPYGALVVYRTALGAEDEAPPPSLRLTALWLPKVSLLTNPLLFLTVNRSARHRLADLLARLYRRYSRHNAVGAGGLGGEGGAAAGGGGGAEASARSGSQLLEMFNIGQRQIFRPADEDEEEEEEEEEEEDGTLSPGAGPRPKPEQWGGAVAHLQRDSLAQAGGGAKEALPAVAAVAPPPRIPSPVHACAYASSSSQVAPATPATPTEAEDASQFGFGPFELPPHWLPETRSSKKRLLPPLGNTPEELIQTKQPRPRPERRISRNNKVSTFPGVEP